MQFRFAPTLVMCTLLGLAACGKKASPVLDATVVAAEAPDVAAAPDVAPARSMLRRSRADSRSSLPAVGTPVGAGVLNRRAPVRPR